MKVYLVPNPTKQMAMEVAQKAAGILREDGAEVILGPDSATLANGARGTAVLPEREALAACDMVLTIGGDGTMLHAARGVMDTGKPLIGVNIGRLGFLTLIESDELDNLHRLMRGDYRIEERSVLAAQVKGREPRYALNDIVLFKQRPEKTISLHMYCDDILVSRFRGDGMIFSTPTGSTAYSMSAGGPIVDAALGGVVVTQICAHIVQTPPLVFAAGRRLRAVSCGAEDEFVHISCDGAESYVLDKGDEVLVTQADKTVPLIQFNTAEQLESIDKKLKNR